MKKYRFRRKGFMGITSSLMILGLVITITLNSVANHWDKPLSDFFGVIGEGVKGGDGTGDLFKSDYETFDKVREAQESLTEQIVAEGTVLLKNEGSLPLSKNASISLFGISSTAGGVSGTGSGEVKGKVTTLKSSLEKAGFTINTKLYEHYEKTTYKHGLGPSPGAGDGKGEWSINEMPFSEIPTDIKSTFGDFNDAAIVVLSRKGGEGGDLPRSMKEHGGSAKDNYLTLSPEEINLLHEIEKSGKFKTTILIINSSGAMELDVANRKDLGVDSILWYTGTGATGVISVGKILKGDVNPSGSLIDTYVSNNLSAPAMQNFGDFRYVNTDGTLSGASYINYAEGIYVGYKYYETRYEDYVMARKNTGNFDYNNEVVFPFGFGLSYTNFEWSNYSVIEVNGKFTAKVTVTNTGEYAGKETVQLYTQSPYIDGGVEKSSVNLMNFGKTKILNPGESETVEIAFDLSDLSSYDYKNNRSYLLDKGTYYIAVGKDSHDALNNILDDKGFSVNDGMDYSGNKDLSFSFERTETTVIDESSTGKKITNRFDDALASDGVYLSRSNWSIIETGKLKYSTGSVKGVSNVTDGGVVDTMKVSEELKKLLFGEGYSFSGAPSIEARNYPSKDKYTYDKKTQLKLADMIGLEYDDPRWDEILDAMKLSEQHTLFNKSGYGTVAIDTIGKPKTYEYDGPGGISNFISGDSGFAFPTQTMLAATSNVELAESFGKLVGEDAIATKTSGWYAPGANIHRTPFSGRNYEYYSEDSKVSGLFAKEVVKAVQSKGVYVFIKHFALNDQETNRSSNNNVATWSNEQAIREIYLKPFQMAVENGGAKGLMMALNRIGTVHATTSYPLITEVTRGEWGFKGSIITDYMAGMSKNYADQFLAAGGDMFLATGAIPLNDAKLDWSRAELRRASKNILFNVTNSLAMNGLSSGGTFSNGIAVYKIILWMADALVAFALFISGKNVLKVYRQTDDDYIDDRISTKKRRIIFWSIVAVIVIVALIAFVIVYLPLIKKAFLM